MINNVEENVASGRALIRRYTILNHQVENPLTIIAYHEIFLCVEYRKLLLKSKEIELTRKEFDFLYLLLSSIGRNVVVELIEKIIVHEGGRIEVLPRYQSAFEDALPLYRKSVA